MKTFISHHPDDLIAIAQWFGEAFPTPTVVLLEGGMGAGKTTLIRAICAHLGAGDMSSPTFSIVNEYNGRNNCKMLHFDLYRLEHTHQALDIGFEEYLHQNAYVFIEWPTVVRPLITQFVEVRIEDMVDQRTIQFIY